MAFDKIPKELIKLPRWVCWTIEDRDGKPTKVPINPTTGGKAMANNQGTWSSFRTALSRAKKDKLPGLGFMFNGDGVLGVDIDNCRDPETGRIEDFASDVIVALDSYTEISQSGKGIHIICRGKLPAGGRRKGSVEMYETGRFFIMTGDALDDGHPDVEERTEQLAAVHEKYINVKKQAKSVRKTSKNVNNTAVFMNDDEIIEKASRAKNGNLFRSLMQGDCEGSYNSQSEADLALCNILAFWTNDASAIDRIFRRSCLFRDKWDEGRGGESTYGQITVSKAINDCIKTYSPGKKKTLKQWEPPEQDLGYDKLFPPPVEVDDSDNISGYDITTDMGRSKIFSDKHKGGICWCNDIKSWLVWNGKNWQADRTLQVIQYAKKTVEEIIKKAGHALNDATGEEQLIRAKQRYKDAVRGKSERSVKAMVELAKSDLPVMSSQFDMDPYLLNCQNGVVDLKTGKIHPHAPEFCMTKIAAASYEKGKKFEKFGEFLNDVTCNDPELASYFQQICGMAAIGKVFYEGIAIFYGGGRNGKSTFLNTISRTMGDYAGSLKPELLMYQRDGRDSVGLAEICGKRFITAIETEEGKRISSSMLKQLASTDPITARRLYENPVTFLPTHTLIMATNFLPKISSTDVGTWRRIAVVPFRAKFEGKKEIKDYASVLCESDGDAILTWIVEGAIKYIKNGCNITLPTVVEQATKEYRSAEDWLGNFLQECCEEGEYEEAGGKLFESYKNWCNQNNESYVRRSRDFASALELSGFEKRRTMHGALWKGLRLVESAQASSLSKYRSDKYKQSSMLDDDGLDEYTRSKM